MCGGGLWARGIRGGFVSALERLAKTLSDAAAAGAAVILVLMTGHMCLEMILRAWFATSTFVLDEFIGYGVGSTTFLALAHTFNDGALIRVHLLIGRLAGPARLAVEIFCVGCTTAAMMFLLVYLARSALGNFAQGTTSSTIAAVPIWIPETVMAIGLLLFCLQLIVYLLRIILDPDRIMGGGATAD